MFGQFGAGFLQGFGESFSENYKERQADFQKYVDLGLESAKRNAPRVKQQNARIAQYEKTQKELETKFGLDKNTFLLLASKGDVDSIVAKIHQTNEEHVQQYGTNIDLTGLRQAFKIAGEVELPEDMTYEEAVNSILGTNLNALKESNNPKSEAAKTQAGAKSFMSFLMRNPRLSAEEAMQQMKYAGYSVSDLANYTEGFSTDVFQDTSIDTTGTGIRFDYDPTKDQARRVSTTTTALYNKFQNIDGIDETASTLDIASFLNVDERTAAEIKRSYAVAADKISILERKLVRQGGYNINAVMRQDLINDLIENLDSEAELATLQSSISKQETLDYIIDRIQTKGGLTQEDIDAIITDTVGKDKEAGAYTSMGPERRLRGTGAEAAAQEGSEPEEKQPTAALPSVITENAELSDVHSKLNTANRKKLEEAAQTGANPIALQKAAEAMLGGQDDGPEKADVAEAPELDDRFKEGVDLKDGTVEQYRRYENMYNGLMELPEDQRSDYLDAFDSLENIPSIKDAVGVIIEDAPAAADALGGYAYGGTGYGVSLFTEGMATVYAALTGDTATAAKVKANTIRNRKEMKEVMANGIVDHLQKIVDDNDIKGGFGPDRAKAVKRAVLENKPLMKAIDSMVTENANGALEANPENPMVKAIAGMLGGDVNAIPAEEVSVTDATASLYGKAQDTETGGGTFSASSKDVLGGAEGDTRENSTEPAAKEVTTITYEQWDDLSTAERRKLGLPTSLVGVQQIVKNGIIELPEGITREFLLKEGFDISPSITDGDIASQVSAMTARGSDRAPNNAGLMSRPAQPSRMTTEERPDMGAVEILPMVARLHGEEASATKRFSDKVSSGDIKASDVTRLIKQTQSLPKTKSRDKLLAELYTMRDELNNR